MNLFDYAMELEKEGEKLYRGFAQDAPEEGMRSIFSMLADQENKHLHAFEEMKNHHPAEVDNGVPLDEVKKIFQGWREKKEDKTYTTPQAELYYKALEVEKKSIDFYTRRADEVEEQTQKDALLKIAKEEKKHHDIMENIIQFIERPERWVEHPMFSKVNKGY